MLAVKRILIVFLVLNLTFLAVRPAHADIAYTKDSKAVGVILGVVAVVAVVGIGVYYAAHHGHSLSGCAVSSPSGVELISDGGAAHWSLTGAIQGIKVGDRIHVTGTKIKGESKTFTVTKVSKDYGLCPVP